MYFGEVPRSSSLENTIATFRERIAEFERAIADLDTHPSELKTAAARAAYAAARKSAVDNLDDLRRDLASLESAQEIVARLKSTNRSGNIASEMVNAARVRISGGKGEGDPFVEALNASHYTMRSLAEKLGVSHALLSRARTGDISLGADVAKRIEDLTGFKASRKNWPKLRG